MAETPFDNSKQLDEEQEKCIERMIVKAIREGKQPPDFVACQEMLYAYAKKTHGFSDAGARCGRASKWSITSKSSRRYCTGKR